jgi:hypothetical protein
MMTMMTMMTMTVTVTVAVVVLVLVVVVTIGKIICVIIIGIMSARAHGFENSQWQVPSVGGGTGLQDIVAKEGIHLKAWQRKLKWDS